MHLKGIRGAAALGAMVALAACGKKVDREAPLAFVPADTAYVIANTEPLPDAALDRWAMQMKAAWPLLFGSFDHAMAEMQAKAPDASAVRVLKALLDEIRERDTAAKWQQIGLGPKIRSAFYGIGLLPVLRIELVDPDALRAAIARVEQKAGGKLATAKIGTQDVWTFGTDTVSGLMAIEGHHLVLAAVPSGADDVLKRRVLGLDKPATSLADSGALLDLDKAHGYLPYGSGWIDVRRTLTLLIDDPAVAALAKSIGEQPPTFEPGCRGEFEHIAANAPRASFGYSALDANRMAVKGRLDLAPAIAQAFTRIAAAPPGSPANDALFDFGVSLPLLKARDFWVEQADAVIKTPFRCSVLAPLNQGFIDAKGKLDQTIPPPLADLTGVRLTMSHLAWPKDAAKPEVSGVLLVGSSNPMFLLGLAQMSVPALRDLKLVADGKPVALPAGIVPPELAGDLEMHAAMSANVLGIAVGKDAVSKLAAAVAVPATSTGVLIDTSYSGALYAFFGDAIGRFADTMPATQHDQFEMQRKLYALYAQWFKRFDARVSVGNEGIDFVENVELANP